MQSIKLEFKIPALILCAYDNNRQMPWLTASVCWISKRYIDNPPMPE